MRLNFRLFAVLALAFGAVAAHAFGVDVVALAQSHPDVLLGLSALGVLGETQLIDDPVKLTAAVNEMKSQVQDVAKKATEDFEKHGKLSTEAKEKADEVMLKFNTMNTQLTELTQRLDAQKSGPQRELTTGEQFVQSEAFKALGGSRGLSTKNDVVRASVKAITSAANSAGAAVAPDFRPDIMALPNRRMTIRDLMLPGTTNGNAITYVRETGFTNNAAPQGADGTKKAESTLVLEAVVQAVTTIAHFAKASKQILDDVPQLQSFIDGRLRYGLQYAEELQLLKGSGATYNLNGIYTQATTYAAPITITDPTRIDTIRLMMLQAFLAEYPATGIVLHPSDWASIELGKDSQGRYIIGDPQGVATPRLWGLPVVETQAMTINTALVGAFRPMSQIFDREDPNVVIATENEDDFTKNLITIRAEERLASAVYRPEAFIKNTALVTAP